jgi:hypothetical protein
MLRDIAFAVLRPPLKALIRALQRVGLLRKDLM